MLRSCFWDIMHTTIINRSLDISTVLIKITSLISIIILHTNYQNSFFTSILCSKLEIKRPVKNTTPQTNLHYLTKYWCPESTAMHWKCDGIFNNSFVANKPSRVPAKQLHKLITLSLTLTKLIHFNNISHKTRFTWKWKRQLHRNTS